MKKKILITGSAGMIGSVLSKYFLNRGYSVTGVDNLEGGFLYNVDARQQFYPADICDARTIKNVFQIERPDYVIHCAAYAAELLSPFIRNYNYTNNLIGSVNVINNCVNFHVKKIVNFSSFATYGEGNPPFRETDPRHPKDCYGIAKLAVEMDLKEAHEHFGLSYSTVLPHNVVSKYQNYFDQYRNVIAIWIRQCMLREKISIFGDGGQSRAFSDCDFLCAPVERLLRDYDDECFNIGSDHPVTIKDAAELVLKVAARFGFESEIVYLEPRREVKIAFCDHSKAKDKLDFHDKTDLEKLVSEMFQYAMTLPKSPIKRMDYEITEKMYEYWK